MGARRAGWGAADMIMPINWYYCTPVVFHRRDRSNSRAESQALNPGRGLIGPTSFLRLTRTRDRGWAGNKWLIICLKDS